MVLYLNVGKAEEINDRIDLLEMHLPGHLPHLLNQNLSFAGTKFTKKNSVKVEIIYQTEYYA